MKTTIGFMLILVLPFTGCAAPPMQSVPSLQRTVLGDWQFEFQVPASEAHVVSFTAVPTIHVGFGPMRVKPVSKCIWGYDGGVLKGIYGAVMFDCFLVQSQQADGNIMNLDALKAKLARTWTIAPGVFLAKRDPRGTTWLCAVLGEPSGGESRGMVCATPLSDRVYLTAHLRLSDNRNPKSSSTWLPKAQLLYDMIASSIALAPTHPAQQ